MSTVLAEIELGEVPEFCTRWHFNDAALQLVLLEIGRESSAGWPLGGRYADLLSLRLALTLLGGQTAKPVRLPPAKGGLPTKSLRMCLEFITDNLHREIRLKDVARTAGLSQFHFAININWIRELPVPNTFCAPPHHALTKSGSRSVS